MIGRTGVTNASTTVVEKVRGIALSLSMAEEKAGVAEAMIMKMRYVGATSSCVNDGVATKEVQGVLLDKSDH